MAAGLAAIAAWLFMSHWLTSHAGNQPWAIAALLGPFWVVALFAALRKRSVGVLAALFVVAALIAVVVAAGGVGDVHRLYLLEHVVIHLALGFSFLITLTRGAGKPSLVEAIAERVHGSLTPTMAAYARRVTVAWVLYFALMAVLSVILFEVADWQAWALFANVGTPVLLIAMFTGEHVLRYMLHPEFERASLMDTVKAYRRGAP